VYLLKKIKFGDIVKTCHRSWSQEKAFVTGMEAANIILKQPDRMHGIIPLVPDEAHGKWSECLLHWDLGSPNYHI